MDIERLNELVVFEEEGTLSKTAIKLHTTQPSISRNLQKLEYELGVELFDKKKNKITLNENGELAVQYAKILLRDFERMKEEVVSLNNKKTTLSIGSCAPLPSAIVVARISYNNENTLVTTVLNDEDTLLNGLKEGVYQLIILPHRVKEKGIICRRVCSEDLYIRCKKNHLLSKKKEISFEEVDGETFLINRNIGFWRNIVEKQMPNSKFLTQESSENVNELFENTNYLSFATDLGNKLNRYNKDYVYIPIKDEDAKQVFYYLYQVKDRPVLGKYLD